MTENVSDKEQLAQSPCVRNCCLNGDDICLGCFRHIDEIVAWRSYSNKEQERVRLLCQQRKENKPPF